MWEAMSAESLYLLAVLSATKNLLSGMSSEGVSPVWAGEEKHCNYTESNSQEKISIFGAR